MIYRVPSPLHFVILLVAGWLNRELQLAVDYLRAENEILREQLPPPRRWLTDAHRRRLAVPAKSLGRAKLAKLGSLCKPETMLAWYRRLVAAKYDLSKPRGVGRPPVKPQVVALILEMAKTTPIHGGHRISGELKCHRPGYVILASSARLTCVGSSANTSSITTPGGLLVSWHREAA